MGKIGGCCCVPPVCCLTFDELPKITSFGQVIDPANPGDWVGANQACCWQSKKIPITYSQNTRLGPLTTQMDDRMAKCDYLVWVRAMDEIEYFNTPYNPWQEIECCSGPINLCNKVHEEHTYRIEEFFVAQQRPTHVQFWLFRKNVSIGGAAPVCKTFLVSEITTQYQVGQYGTAGGRHFMTGGEGGCCGAYGLFDTTTTAKTIDEIWAELDKSYGYSFGIYSAKMYDDIPTGGIDFVGGEIVENISFGGGVPCVPVDWPYTGGEVVSSGGGAQFPWFYPTIQSETDTFRSNCYKKMIFALAPPETNCRANQRHCDPGAIVEYVKSPPARSYATPMLQGAVWYFSGVNGVNVIWSCYVDPCIGEGFYDSRFLSALVMKHSIEGIDALRSYQPYTERRFTIEPPPWSATIG